MRRVLAFSVVALLSAFVEGPAAADDSIHFGEGILFEEAISIDRRDPSIQGDAPRTGFFIRSNEGVSSSATNASGERGRLSTNLFGAATFGLLISRFDFVELANRVDGWRMLSLAAGLEGVADAIQPRVSGRHWLDGHFTMLSSDAFAVDADFRGGLLYAEVDDRGLRRRDIGPGRFRELTANSRLWFRDKKINHEHFAFSVAHRVRYLDYSDGAPLEGKIGHRVSASFGMREYERESRGGNDFVAVAYEQTSIAPAGGTAFIDKELSLKVFDFRFAMRGYEARAEDRPLAVLLTLDFFVGWSWLFGGGAAGVEPSDNLFVFSLSSAYQDPRVGSIGGGISRAPLRQPDGRRRMSRINLETFATWAPDDVGGGASIKASVGRLDARPDAMEEQAPEAEYVFRMYAEAFVEAIGGQAGVFASIGNAPVTGGLPWDPFLESWQDVHEAGVFARWK